MPAGNIVPALPQRSPPSLLTTAACGGLKSAPDCRSRRALLHLSYSYAPSYSDGTRDTRPMSDIRIASVHECYDGFCSFQLIKPCRIAEATACARSRALSLRIARVT